MNSLSAAAVVLGLVGAATVLGLLWRSRQGRVSQVRGDVITPADVATEVVFGKHATLVQFSTQWCSRCPGTGRLLARVADARTGVVHLDVDVSDRADIASRFSISQTPTTLILDANGRVHARVGGVPNAADITRQLDELAALQRESPTRSAAFV
ncbi:TlpA family protein disulfide reductase [Cryobacterium psychrophilum]|uniref:Thioredoxin n=1 Tax=Cryobacterium psychrophilum TaxID=41988 RepID=A0A4Y8KNI3_9MICO|nr:thioredoxin family protein [Cryobacterium psychrophilum]TDW29027.1 thiol-disulfide isomerase/thioredoxin [Cryobacterium psychrophilum]TFD79757.1 thioredoxin [Cryobacterium psychrophilum]